ncbi:hypothetical protein L1049_000294 [Liquidambar formosana]|uniref:Uncharacterized protein n=1 Tax=Liquidambar formosana TaxID=63359 RepID=A0AAP0N8Q0_LIQFO
MREVYRNAYVPKIISIGPFHYEEQGRQVIEEHKRRYLLRLLGGRLQENGEQALPQVCNGSHLEDVEHAVEPVPKVRKAICLEDLVGAMRELEQKTRVCYSEDFNINSDDFVQMMVVDGCFVVELLRLYKKLDKEDVDDPIFTTRWMLRTLQRDLLMLENQLPFFVLEELFKLTSLVEEPSLVELTLKFFDPLLPRENTPQPNPKIKFDHMLHVFRSTFLSSVKDETSALEWRQLQTHASIPLVRERQLIHCVKELQEAGVKLKKREDRQLLDINFEGRVLDIPPLYIDANTVPLLLNFVAYEQCDQKAEPFFTNFFMFFDSLINTAEDVEILHKNESLRTCERFIEMLMFPKIISIGPFHYGDQGVQVMEEHKMRYLLRLLGGRVQEIGENTGEPEPPQVQNGSHSEDVEHEEEALPQVRKVIRLEDLARAMRELEQKTRECYSEAFNINSDDFVQMMAC